MIFSSFFKKFNDSLDTAVFTTVHVAKEKSLITKVYHELDGAWQFMGNETFDDFSKVAMIVSLAQIIKIDRTVLKVSDLQVGYQAMRNKKSAAWVITKINYSDDELRQFGYYCSKCGLYHKDIPMAYGTDAPALYFLIAADQREKRCWLTNDQCVIDEKHYYVRARIELTVDDSPDNFFWNVWVEVNKQDFERMTEMWQDENRFLEPPYAGEIATQLEPYPQTYGLRVNLITQAVGIVPKVQLLESDHPLYFEQDNNINMDRVIQFAKEILYNH